MKIILGITGLILLVFSVVLAHFVQIGNFDVQIIGVLTNTILANLFLLVLKIFCLCYQFVLVDIGICLIFFKSDVTNGRESDVFTAIATLMLVIYVAGVAIIFILNLVWTRPEMVTVVQHTWTITKQVEEYQILSLEDWEKNLPGDAYDKACSRQMNVTNDDKYENRCGYKIKRWVVIDNLVTQGGWLDKPYVADYAPKYYCAKPEVGCRHSGSVDKVWMIYMRGQNNMFSGDAYACNVDAQFWMDTPNNVLIDLGFGVLDGTPRCGKFSNMRSGVITQPAYYQFPDIVRHLTGE